MKNNSLILRALIITVLLTNFFGFNLKTIQAEDSGSDYSESFAGGSGTEADPWQITTCQELQNINYYDETLEEYPLLDDNFILNNDIDCSETATWNEDPENPGEYLGFEPLGFYDLFEGLEVVFEGVFDGDNHSINNLYINRTGGEESGLFIGLFRVSMGEIKNVNLVDVDIEGYAVVGGIASFIEEGSLSGSSVSGSVFARGTLEHISYAGGLVGAIMAGSIEQSFSSATVLTIGPSVGGLVGFFIGGTISDSYATGSVTTAGELEGYSFAGGFIGVIEDAVDIDNCYAVGDVTADGGGTSGFIGGISNENVSVNNSFSTGNVISEQPEINQFIGFNSSSLVENSYYYLENNIYQYGTSEPILESDVSYFYDLNNTPLDEWDFESIWLARESDYPILAWQLVEEEEEGEEEEEEEEEEEDGNNENQQEEAQEEDEEEGMIIKIKEIKKYCDSLELELSTNGQEKKEDLDIKVKIENQKTGEKTEQKFTKETNNNGRVKIILENLNQNTNYKIKVKYKQDGNDEYSEWSDSKKVTTATCQTNNLALVNLNLTQSEGSSFPGQLNDQNQDKEKKGEKNNKQNNFDKIMVGDEEEDKKEVKTGGFWNILIKGATSIKETIKEEPVKAFFLPIFLIILIITIVIIWWKKEDK